MTHSTSLPPVSRPPAGPAAASTRWTAGHVAVTVQTPANSAPTIGPQEVSPVADGLGIWDAWPACTPEGTVAVLPGEGRLWMALGAPRFDNPEDRHGHARIQLLLQKDGRWRHLGPLMPDGFSPGSREWSGSAVLEDKTLTLYFTATGRRGEARQTFEQRLFSTRATLAMERGYPRFVDWRDCSEIVARDPVHYMSGDDGAGAIGTIKAFRDPFYFRDPNGGAEYIFFAGSSAVTSSAFNGVIGYAVRGRDRVWQLRPPLISADGLNNELERPHIVHRDNYYYLFWSTQRHVFNPEGPTGPTGLYGMASRALREGWEPLNGNGLVLANPEAAPRQAYSWLVLPDLSVASFADELAPAGKRKGIGFAGTFAPFLKIRLDGPNASLAS